jgi:GNAT superfamily N-acetyltransferase
MNWLPLDQLRSLIALPPGLRVESLHSAHIAAVIAALRSWYPDVAYGSNRGYLRDEFYRQRVCLDGAHDKDIQVFTIWSGDEMVGLWSPEREVDSLALYAHVGAVAPQHAGAGLMRQVTAGMEDVARTMGAAFMYALVTLKHPYMAQALEHAGYRLLGFFPGFDRELVAPGVVKRVYQAVYAKLLVPEDRVLRPDPKNLTPGAKALFELLFSD